MPNYELRKHKKSDKIKWIATALAGVLLAGACATTIAMGITQNGWFEKDDSKIEVDQPVPAEDEGGVVVSEGTSTGIKVMSTKMATADYATYNVSPQADSAYTLTAIPEPADAAGALVDWSFDWTGYVSSDYDSWTSEELSGKTITDYISWSTPSDGSQTVVLEVLQPFGAQIIGRCTWRSDTTVYAEFLIDYGQRIESIYMIGSSSYGVPAFNMTDEKVNCTACENSVYNNREKNILLFFDCFDCSFSGIFLTNNFAMTRSITLNPEFVKLFEENGLTVNGTNKTASWTSLTCPINVNGSSSIDCPFYIGNSVLTDLYSVNEDGINTAVGILKENCATLPIFTLDITISSNFQQLEYSVPFYYSADCFEYQLSGIAVDNVVL